MDTLFNKRVLYLIPVVFLILISFRIFYSYNDAQQRKYDFAFKEAQSLSTYSLIHRDYYQKLFIDKILPLNEKTLPGLPAYSSRPLAKIFSENNTLNIIVRTVSDRARNEANTADIDELKAIDYFKKNKDKDIYFSDENEEFYQFASVLRIEHKCLKCHGEKEKAPLFIQQRYDKAYNYKAHEVRGIQSVKVPVDILNDYFMTDFFYSVIYDFVLFVILFISIFILLKKSKQINDYLKEQVDEKTNELRNSLTIDPLTKLPNRLQLLEDIESSKDSEYINLALININRFKDINDFYGHDIGDIVLKSVALEIQSICTNSKSFLYKLPSDEFAIYTTKEISEKEFFEFTKSILNKLNNIKIDGGNYSFEISVSVGVSSKNDFILAKADMALQVAKSNTDGIILYDESINTSETIVKNIQGIIIIRDALNKNNVVPYFQPIYNMKTKKIEKYEALARIIKDNGRVLSPYSFLDIAIKSKLYPNITKTMISKTFEFFKDKEYEFSINISTEDILNKHTIQFIIDKLEKFPHPERIVFEILESDRIENYEELKEFIISIKKYNCKFAIDDFGSGYSNFSHVLALNIDYLKIDASLVKCVTTDENSRVITQTIINFAATLGLKTIAEFVESKESLDLLEDMGIDYVQGYYIGKPQPELNTDFK